MPDVPRAKTMLNVPTPPDAEIELVGPPELLIAENRELRTRVAAQDIVLRAAQSYADALKIDSGARTNRARQDLLLAVREYKTISLARRWT